MKRSLFGITLFAIIVLVAAHLSWQRAGQARVVRRGDNLKFLTRSLGWAPRYGVATCTTSRSGERLEHRSSVEASTRTGDPISIDVRFQYDPAARVPQGWPEGDWCAALSHHVEDFLKRWTATADRDALLLDLRRAGWSASAALDLDLRKAGLSPDSISARFRTTPVVLATRPVPAVVANTTAAPPVIFIGLDGADWQLLDEYMRAGMMPNLTSLVRDGTSGVLLTQHPPLSPLLWTTMMTGVNPLEHQILDFTRFHPQTRVKEPITADERHVPAIWNMATYGGKSVAVFGLWATYPAEAVRGTLVSDRLFSFLFTEATPPERVVYPPSRESWAKEVLAQAESRVGFDEVREYLPWLTEPEYSDHANSRDPYGHPVSALRRILIETAVYDALASDRLQHDMPALTILYLQGTDSIGHVFAPFTSPRQPQISQTDFDHYHDVPEKYFRSIDGLLGKYKTMAERSGARLMIASDHGFHWHEDRPTQLSSFAAATAAKWHRKEGIYLLWGPGIPARGAHSGRGSVSQVCATLLALSGLPPGVGLAGPPLIASATRHSVDYRAFYTPVATARGEDNQGAEEELAKLRALGYIGPSESTRAASGSGTRSAGSYNNEGLIFRDQKRPEQAIAAFERALQLDPDLASALWNLSDILFDKSRDSDRSDQLLVRAFANGLPEGMKFLIGRAIGYQRGGKPERSLKLLEAAVTAQPDNAELHMFRGRYRIELRDCAGALADFRAAQAIEPGNPATYSSAGLAAVCVGDHADAERNFRRSLALDPDQPQLQRYLRSIH